ncbi:MAG: TAXI family TRAP transporter solute-binding subunit [Alphaproteobacteria bacterium]
MRLRSFALAVLAVVAVGWTAVGAAQEIRFFRIGTGGTAGTYYPVGGLIANAISNPPGSRPCDKGGSCGVPGLVAMVQSSNGSVENVEQIGAGTFELALSQADIAYWAYHGTGLFADKGAITGLRVIANLYPESLHVVVRRDAGIKGVAELKGKRVSLGERGSGTLVDAKAVLAAYGLDESDVVPEYLPPGAASLAMSEGKLDAFVFVAGYPVTAISDLAKNVDIELLPVAGPEADELAAFYPFFTTSVIPAGVYNGIGEVPTISIGAQLLVSADIDEETVYDITRALWHESTRQLFDRGHAKARVIRLETALDGVAVPLHPGAERYYEEAKAEAAKAAEEAKAAE